MRRMSSENFTFGFKPRNSPLFGLPPNYVPHLKLEIKYLFLLASSLLESILFCGQ